MKNIYLKYRKFIHPVLFFSVILIFTAVIFWQRANFLSQLSSAMNKQSQLSSELSTSEKKYLELVNQDQYKRNEDLQKDIKAIENTYKKTTTAYESLIDLKLQQKTDALDLQFAAILKLLSEKNYASAEASLNKLSADIKIENDKIAAKAATQTPGTTTASSANVAVSNTPPGSGYSRQRVNTEIGELTVDIVAGDLGSTKVIVDTASDNDCSDNCPVLSLSDYVSRNGAFAGINGTYFCPAAYPTCAGKTNSFDLLIMNKNKKYFNSDNNVYSTNPVVIFLGGSVRFVAQASGWGRDTGPDSVISNFPLLVLSGNIVFGGDGDPKKGSKGSRSFVAAKGNTVYIGVVHNATVAEAAHALKGLGMEHAMNLDSGGSTALWSGGYKAGPGRNIPNAILFVRK